MTTQIEHQLISIVHEFDDSAPVPTPETVIGELGFDSLGIVEIMLACENEWPGTHFDEDDVEFFTGSIHGLAILVEERLAAL
jgi:acyl carrier protein